MNRRTAPDPLVGDVLDGRYEVLQRLARGGMATVYRAWDRRLERIIAIKVMHESLSTDVNFTAKFDREARAAARLCDHNVVAIYDQGFDHQRPYIVMEYVPGSTLRTLITRKAPLTPIRALEIIEPVASALAVAHESGLVHRDVKPENVLINGDGEIKVADFGLARTVSAQTATHSQGLLIGTVSYLPPELLTTGKATSASDVYSTGVVLWEMLTGSKPYIAEQPIQVAYKHVNEDMLAPSVVLGKSHPGQARREPIPDYLDALVLSCTRRDAQMRPANGRELLHRIRVVRKGVERGLGSDADLVALAFPAAVSQAASTQVLTPDMAATSVIASSQTAQPVLSTPRSTAVTPAPDDVDENDIEQTPVEQLETLFPAPDRRDTGVVASPRFPKLSTSPIHRRRRALLAAILLVLLTLGVGSGAWWLTSGRYTQTPSLINMTEVDARPVVAAANLTVRFTQGYSEDVPAGQIISTDPSAGSRVLRDSEIVAVVSLGPERNAMPHIIGLGQQDATDALAQAGLAIGRVEQAWSETVETGHVISAGYDPGTMLRPGTTVDLTISKGREPISIPSVVNRTLAEANTTLTTAGFKVTTADGVFHDSIPEGSVVSQNPSDGTGHRGDTITLTPSKGAEKVHLPNIRANEQVSEATKKLEDAGFKVRVDWPYSLPFRRGVVIDITDESGKQLLTDDQLAKGSTVVIIAQ